ncbi:MAG: glycosyltransferase, partial [Candidatus Hodarchaeota archaeon]
MMKICMIYYAFLNTMLLREAEALIERGHHVDIICLGRVNTAKQEYSNNLNVYRVQRREYGEKGIFSYLWKYGRFFISSSFLVTLLHVIRSYNLIHVTSPPDFIVFTSFFPKFLGAKIILDIHDIMPEFFARKFGYGDKHWSVRLLKWIERISAKFSDHVITVTDLWKTTLVNRSVPESKCSVLLNVPDTKIFKREDKKERPGSEQFTLFYPGNVDFGVDTLIKAMRIISREIPFVRLKIYGSG